MQSFSVRGTYIQASSIYACVCVCVCLCVCVCVCMCASACVCHSGSNKLLSAASDRQHKSEHLHLVHTYKTQASSTYACVRVTVNPTKFFLLPHPANTNQIALIVYIYSTHRPRLRMRVRVCVCKSESSKVLSVAPSCQHRSERLNFIHTYICTGLVYSSTRFE